jgi:hypothetical protein
MPRPYKRNKTVGTFIFIPKLIFLWGSEVGGRNWKGKDRIHRPKLRPKCKGANETSQTNLNFIQEQKSPNKQQEIRLNYFKPVFLPKIKVSLPSWRVTTTRIPSLVILCEMLLT